jgi:hypothetical protein
MQGKGESMQHFKYMKTKVTDSTGLHFYVGYGREFDEERYERKFGIKPPVDVCKEIQKLIDDLQHDEWVQISQVEHI